MRTEHFLSKKIYCIIILLLMGICHHANAQPDASIQQLEAKLIHSENEEYIQTAIELSRSYLQQGEHYKAIQRAQSAFEKATLLDNKYYMALALNSEAKAMLAKEKKQGGKLDMVVGIATKFAKSLELLKGLKQAALKRDNVEQLRGIAKIIGDSNLEAQYVKQLELMKDGLMDDPIAIGENGLGNSDKAMGDARKNIFNRAKEQTDKLNDKVEDLSEEREKLEAEKELLSTERELLEQHMQAQRTAIAELNMEQLGSELMISHQRVLMDSLLFARQLDSFKLQRSEIELRQQKSALRLERYQRRFFIALALLAILIALGFLFRHKSIKRHNKQLELKNQRIKEEQARSDDLLRNILPASIAEELKVKGSIKPKLHEVATVMFTDFKNFSAIAEKLSPDELVSELHHCFKAFDEIIEQFGLEKIKTIGDAYMCAGGLPAPDPTHPENVVAAALAIQDFLKQWNVNSLYKNDLNFEARIGIHTGPVVAGIVGIHKFAYDVWGDTVNIAARMESHGEPGKVNISSSTYELVKDKYECAHRGKLPTRDEGDIEMYFVETAL